MAENEAPSRSSGVRKVNNKPMMIVVGLIAVFILVMGSVMMHRAEKQRKPAEKPAESGSGNTNALAKGIIDGSSIDGLIPAAVSQDMPLAEPDQAVPIASVPGSANDRNRPPIPMAAGTAGRQKSMQDEADMQTHIRQIKLQQLEEAIKAKTSVGVVAPHSSTAASTQTSTSPSMPAGQNQAQQIQQTRDDVAARLAAVRQQLAAQQGSGGDTTGAFKARLAQMQSGLGAGVGMQTVGLDETDQAGTESKDKQNSIDKYARKDGKDRWKLGNELEAPRTPYTVQTTFVIPATLISSINSELPGTISAQVSQNIYDTPTGRHMLIPLGSRLTGAYSSDVAYGQSRVLIAWQRIVFPDGKSLDISAMPGADGMGSGGLEDQVNNHYARLFGSALLMSAVTAGVSMSQQSMTGNNGGGTTSSPTAQSALSWSVGQQLGQVTSRLIQKNMNISPTLEIRSGFRFNVIVTKDLAFSKPYKAFDY